MIISGQTHRQVFPVAQEIVVSTLRSKIGFGNTKEIVIQKPFSQSIYFTTSAPLVLGNCDVYVNGRLLPQIKSRVMSEALGRHLFNYEITRQGQGWNLVFNYDGPEGVRSVFPYDPSGLANAQVQLKLYSDLNEQGCVKVNIPRHLLMQGVDTEDNALSRSSVSCGYRTHLCITAPAKNGIVRVGTDRTSFWYYPDRLMFGLDSFNYKLINSLGQESNDACIFIRLK